MTCEHCHHVHREAFDDAECAEKRVEKLETENVNLRASIEAHASDMNLYERRWTETQRKLNDALLQIQEIRKKWLEHTVEEATKLGKHKAALNGLLGLIQLIQGRNDIPEDLHRNLTTNHRYVEALDLVTEKQEKGS